MTVAGLEVQVHRKAIKNLHLGVYPPDGRVRVAAPPGVSEAAVRVAVINRLPWIKTQRARFQQQAREPAREMVSGESHLFCGRRLRLEVLEEPRANTTLELKGRSVLVLRTPRGSARATRYDALQRWYRARLRELARPLLERWEATLGVHASMWGIKRMKTKWGACNPTSKRVWLNLELVKKPPACLEYVVVHELVHLRVRKHDARFMALMERHLPAWRHRRIELNKGPLGEETWGC